MLTGVSTSIRSYHAAAKRPGTNDIINVGVIGTGDRGNEIITLLHKIKGVHLGAVCDVLPFRLTHGLKRAGDNVKGYSEYYDLLNDTSIDAIIIATPFNTHAEIAIDSLSASKHVYCEKTMAKGIKAIDHLVNQASNSNTVFQTGHQFRNSKLYQHVVDLIMQGEIGQVASFDCHWNRKGNWRRPVPDPMLERAINWRMYREYSGGLTAELCSHQIDFVNWALGENPRKIMGAGGIDYWKDGRETFDNVHLLFEYPSGVKASFTCLTTNASDGYQIKIRGSKGTILLQLYDAWISYEDGDEEHTDDVDGLSGATASTFQSGQASRIAISQTDPSQQALMDFRDSILSNKLPDSNIFTGSDTSMAVQLSLNAMYQGDTQHWRSNQVASD